MHKLLARLPGRRGRAARVASRADLTGTEHEHQVTLFSWAALEQHRFPELEFMFAVPNGGKRDPRVAAKLKLEGVRRGVPDVWLPVPRGGYHGLVFEMKSGDNKETAEQKKYLRFLSQQGYLTATCYTWEDAKVLVENYLEGKWINHASTIAGATAP